MLSDLSIKTVAVFRALQLGDMLCAVPALKALRAGLPHAQITLLGLPWEKEFVERYSAYLDLFLEFPGFPGLPEQPFSPQKSLSFLNQLAEFSFDLLIQMQGDGSVVNPLLSLVGAKHLAGFYKPGKYCPNEATFLPYPTSVHEIHRHLLLMEHLGFSGDAADLQFPITPADRKLFSVELAKALPHRFICIHPGARSESRRWHPLYFAQLGDLAASLGYGVVLTGTEAERGIVESVIQAMNSQPINLAGKTTLGTMAVLLEQSKLLLANDTGVSHLAAALRVPSLIISLIEDQTRWNPLDSSLHKVVTGLQLNSLPEALSTLEEILSNPKR